MLSYRIRCIQIAIIFLHLACCSGQRTEADGTSSSTLALSSTSSGSGATGQVPTSSHGGSTTEGQSTSSGGMAIPDLPSEECGPFAPDCPPGMKCSAYGSRRLGSWQYSKCVPVVDDPDALGEECEVFKDYYSGEDSCEAGAMCWDIVEDTLIGECVPVCAGTSREPICTAPHSFCFEAGSVAICLAKCSPFLNCGQGTVCDRDPNDPGGFACAMDLPGGGVFSPCSGDPGTCDVQLACLPSAAAVECDPLFPGCCVPYCVVGDMNDCPGVGQECQPVYANPDEAPPLLGALGVCTVP